MKVEEHFGPKIDLKVKMQSGEWQTSTIQFDFNLPERFDLKYIGSDGEPHRPFMVHRALFGSLERFGILTEHYAGGFPLGFLQNKCESYLLPKNNILCPPN